MSRGLWVTVVALAALAALLTAHPGPAVATSPGLHAGPQRPAPEFVDGVVVVGFRDGTSAATRTAIASAVGGTTQRIGRRASVLGVGRGKVAAAIATLRANPNVRYAEPDYVYRLAELPNDPSFPQLWGLENTGQPVNGTGGAPDADIDAAAAWDVTTGSGSVIVGVIDTGIDYSHPDLAANVWSNPGGVGGCPAGTHGYNAVTGTCDPLDDNNHGSHTSGTIGAVGNNGIGVTGINWTTRIVAIKAFNASGSTTSTSIAQSLQWVLDARAAGVNIRVLNNSWGGWDSSQVTLDLIQELAAQDVVFVAAAGNFGIPNNLLPFYPCDYPVATIICVGASTQSDQLAYFSNWGVTSVDLAAPGTNVLSTIRGGGYGYADGTSMATPHVTGAAALLLSMGDRSAADVKAGILGSVDVLPALNGKVATSGRLNLATMLLGAGTPGSPSSPTLSATAGVGSVDLSWTAPAPGGSPIRAYRIYRATASGDETLLAEVGDVRSHQDTDVVVDTAYYYQVSAVNDTSEGPRSNEVTARPTAPPTVPGQPVLTGVAGAGSATLCWTAPPDGGAPITTFRLYRSIDSVEDARDVGPVDTYTDPGLIDGSTYVYQVSAVNAVGEGSRSDIVTLTPPGQVPVLDAFSPTVATGGTEITISGAALGGGECGTTVTFDTRPGSVTGATATTLGVLSPAQGGSGRITVTTGAGQATSATDFFAVPAGSTAAEVTVTGRLAIGAPRVVSLPVAGKMAMFLFAGSVGQRISLNVTAVSIGQSDISILNPDGSTLASVSGVGGGGTFFDTRTLAQAGTYAIVVNPRAANTGSLTLTLYEVPPDLSPVITPGGPALPVAIPTPGLNARVTFAGSVGQRISLNVTAVSIGQSDISILNPDGSTLASVSGVGGGGTFFDTRTLAQAGTYAIVVNPRAANTGSLTLTLYEVPPDLSPVITPGGPALPVAIPTPGLNARVTFAGSVGQRISLNVTAVSIGQSDISILNPDGSTLASVSGVGGGGTFFDTRTLAQAGTYAIVVNPRAANTGSLTLTLYEVPPDLSPVITPGGPALPVAIPTPGLNARVTFAGSVGQRISLNVTAVSIGQSDISILNPDGSTLASVSGVGGGGTFFDTRTLAQAGTYAIVVNPRAANTGSLTLTLYEVPPDLSPVITPGGPALPVAIPTPGLNARVTFAGSVGQRISLNVTAVSIGQSDISILNPDGSTLASVSGVGGGGTFFDTRTLAQAGTYAIVVNPRAANTGSLTLTLYEVPPDLSPVITPGGPALPVAIPTPGLNARVTFAGSATTAYSLVISGVTIAQTDVSILRPDGSTLVGATLVTTSGKTMTFTTSVAGTYTILVNPRGTLTGSLTLRL